MHICNFSHIELLCVCLFIFFLIIDANLLTTCYLLLVEADGKRAKAPASLVRPLNWFFFLPTLVALRFIRVMLSLVSICLGFDEIEASTMVTFLHESRRNIRQVLLEAKHRNKRRHSVIYDYVKQQVLSFLTSLSALISQTSDTNKVHNKTSVIVKTVHELSVQCYTHE